jgi:hypothetical protein
MARKWPRWHKGYGYVLRAAAVKNSRRNDLLDDTVNEMVCPITGAECYVRETGRSMKAVELAASLEDDWRNIPILLIDLVFGEQTAQACANAFHERA